MKPIFWICTGLIIYSYGVYFIVITLLAKIAGKNVRRTDDLPSVTLIISAYNEAEYIERKLLNTLSLDYPQDRLEVIIVCDGSSDGTNLICNGYISRGITIIRNEKRQGKSASLKKAVEIARGEILVFSDANNMYCPSALKMLVRNFGEECIGGVFGQKIIYTGKDILTNVSLGEGKYWRYENMLKRAESAVSSITGASGEIYAIRRELFPSTMDDDIITDDLYITLQVILQGRRFVWEEEAHSLEEASLSIGDEFLRKARIVNGGWQTVFRMPSIVNPFKSPIAVQFISHKIIRWLTVPFLLGAFISAFQVQAPLYRVLFSFQCLFYLMALTGLILNKGNRHPRIFYYPFYFCMANIAALLGLIRFLLRTKEQCWRKSGRGLSNRLNNSLIGPDN